LRLLPSALAGGLIVIGAAAIVAPATSSSQYGVATEDPSALAFVRATGARDLILGLAIAGSLGDQRALARLLGWVSLLGLADAAVLFAARGVRPQHVIHLSGFIALGLASVALKPRD
jgi:hypothetical protein